MTPEEFLQQFFPYILLLAGALVWIIDKSKPHIVKMFKNKADSGEAAVRALEEKLNNDLKKEEIKSDAQNFLSDVGRNYFEALVEESQGLRTQLTDSEELNAELQNRIQEIIIEREEFRIKYNTVSESYQEAKERLVLLESESIKNGLLIDDFEGIKIEHKHVIRQMESDISLRNEKIESLTATISELANEKKLLNKRFDEERAENERLNDEVRALRKNST